MILHFKEDRYHWGDSFYIYDENNQRAFRVKSSIMLWNRKFQIFDLEKNLLAEIKNEPKSLIKKKYYITIGGESRGAITKEISIVPKYTMDDIDWEMRGAMLHEYDMLKSDGEALSFHTEVTPWGHRPVLHIADSVDPLLALAVVLTISYVMNAEEGGTSTNHI